MATVYFVMLANGSSRILDNTDTIVVAGKPNVGALSVNNGVGNVGSYVSDDFGTSTHSTIFVGTLSQKQCVILPNGDSAQPSNLWATSALSGGTKITGVALFKEDSHDSGIAFETINGVVQSFVKYSGTV